MKPSVRHDKTAKVAMDPSWKTILEQATVEVFEMMAGARLEAAAISDSAAGGEHTAMVGLAGALCGMVTLRCTRQVAHRLASMMLGGEAAENSFTAKDALGELCNMVAGNFKAKISTLADRCMLSVPTVITGSDYEMDTVEPTSGISTRFTFEGDPVIVALMIHA